MSPSARRGVAIVFGVLTVLLAISILLRMSWNHAASPQASSPSASISTPNQTPIPVTITTPTPLPTPQGVPVGQTITTTTNATMTVEQTATADSGNDFETPPPGGSFLAAKVKICAGDQQEMSNPVGWYVKLADDTQVSGTFMTDATPGPALPIDNVQPGSCVAGWLYFPLPASPSPVEIAPKNSDFFWTLG